MKWESSLEDLDEVTKQLKVAIAADYVEREYQSSISRFSGQAKIKGFRPGKAPRQVVQQFYGQKIRSDLISQLVSESLLDILKEHQLQLVGMPEVNIDQHQPDQSLSYSANISVLPTPTIAGYDQFEVSVEFDQVTSQDVDQAIENLRRSKATARPLSDRKIAGLGDVIEAEFLIVTEGERPDNRAEPLTFALGDGRLPEQLEQGVVGMAVGETKRIAVSQAAEPEHSNDQPAASVLYQVTLKALSERLLPEVDDSFAISLGYGAETLLDLRVKLSASIENSRRERAKQEAQVKVLEQLLERNSFKVPQVMIDNEIRAILVREGWLDPKKQDPSDIPMEPFREHFNQLAFKRVAVRIIVDRLAQQEKIELDGEDLEKGYNDLAREWNVSLAEVKGFFKENERQKNFTEELKRSKILDFLVSRTKINYVSKDALASE